MSMTPSEDERVARILLGNPTRWRSEPVARQAAEVRAQLAQARATRAANILTYLTADRSDWPTHVDQMMRAELGIDDMPPAPEPPAVPAVEAGPFIETEPPLDAWHPVPPEDRVVPAQRQWHEDGRRDL
jgi:hypothetical protein